VTVSARRGRAAREALLALTALVGCVHAPGWMVQRAVMAEDVARVLDEPAATERPLMPSDVPVIPVRKGSVRAARSG
jgi:hypothetical protein